MLSNGVALGSLFLAFVVQTGTIAFWLGRMSQRVQAVEKGFESNGDLTKTVTELRVEQSHTNKALDKLGREMEGVHRQLANIATGRIGLGGEMS